MQNTKEFKDTLNLPKTTLAMRANATVRELEIQKFWEENKIYDKLLDNKEKSFILHDGPPYLSSDKIHVGTALNKILKDIILKYKAQQGFYTPYVPGYDAHGLPIENAVVKNLKGGRHSISEGELRKLCREYAKKSLKGQEAAFRRLGVLGNWENPYLTIDPSYEAEQIRVFGQMYKKGYIEKGLKPVYWCASCETALAEAEVEYNDHTSTSIFVRFKFEKPDVAYEKAGLKSDKPLYVVIWTTTPWTIPSNLAVCLNSRLDYVVFEHEGENYIVAEGLKEDFIKNVEWEENETLATFKGAELENLNVLHPLYNWQSKIVLGDHVTLDAGTGCVHTAPGHGLEDWEACQKYGIETFSPLNNRGEWEKSERFNDGDLIGVPYYKGNEIVINKLTECGALLKKSDLTHSYPHCWRCKHPVIYRATPQWFVRVDKFRNKAMEAIKNVKWIPTSGESRIGNMVEGRTDWCISRQRAWGVPIPIFYCEDCGEVICTDETIENIAKIYEKESSDAWVNHSEEELLPVGFKCPKCGKNHFRKEKDIMDVWFDSGVSWHSVVERRPELGEVPVDMYLEGSDQHRGWFQSSLLTCVATKGVAPYKQVLTHGFVFGEDGRKMSKSLGNYIRTDDIIKNYGADILRLWAASVDYKNDIKIGNNIVGQLVEIFKKTRNTARFLLGNLFDFEPERDYVKYENLKPIDKFALHKTNVLIQNVTEAFENYEFYKYFQHLQNFAAVDLSAFYLDIVKDRLYTAGKKSLSRRACQTVMFEILQTLVRILVPVMPHQAEDIWQNVPEIQKMGTTSALLLDWAKVRLEWNNEEIEKEYTELLRVRENVSKAIEFLRANKNVGSSLEADILIQGENLAVLEKYKNELADLFIVSHVFLGQKEGFVGLFAYESNGLKINVKLAEGEKCQRCWKYRELNANGICEDCAEAVNV